MEGSDSLDTGPLLAHLDEDTVHGAQEHAVLKAEAVKERRVGREALVLDTLDDRVELGKERRVLLLEAAELGEVRARLVVVVALHVVARRLGREDGADERNRRPDELESDREAPREVIAGIVERVVDRVREEAEGREGRSAKVPDGRQKSATYMPMVAMSWYVPAVHKVVNVRVNRVVSTRLRTGDQATEVLGRALGLEERRKERERADAETGDEASSDLLTPLVHARGLDGNTDAVDEKREDEAHLDADAARGGADEKGTKESCMRRSG